MGHKNGEMTLSWQPGAGLGRLELETSSTVLYFFSVHVSFYKISPHCCLRNLLNFPWRAMSLFLRAIQSVLDSWPAFCICVEHGCGDADRVAWFPEAIEQWLLENKGVYADELEDTMADILDREFNTVVDDNSMRDVASRILRLQDLCQKGQTAEVEALMKGSVSAKGTTAKAAVSPADGEDDDDDDT